VQSRNRVDTGTPLPKVVERYPAEKSLPTMMSNLRREIERRAEAAAP